MPTFKSSFRIRKTTSKTYDSDRFLAPGLWVYWNRALPLDILSMYDYQVKRCIRDRYLDILDDYVNSICQRNISLNSKRLAILNCRKQIINKSSEFAPYGLIFHVDIDTTLRKCDEKRRSYHISR